MAYSREIVEEALRLVKNEGVSGREAARRLGVGATTVSLWLAADAAGRTPELSPAPDEEAVTALLLRKAHVLVSDIETWPESKERLEVASAVDKLLGKYLALTGAATESHVTVESSPELAAWANALVKVPGASKT